ncbi:hypothetical protein ABIF67_003447 [Bradyrhizobium japonicum]
MRPVVGILGRCFGFSIAEDDRHHVEHQDLRRVAAERGGFLADRGDARRNDLGRRSRHEHAFGMLRRELPAARRGAGLVQHRRPLRRRLAEMDGVADAIIRALMIDAMNLARIGEDAARPVAQNGVVLPAAFPELVDHLHIFVGDVVAVVVSGLLVLAGAARGAVEIAGDDVPADPSLGEMVERRHPPRERVGRFEGQVTGDTEAEIFRHRRHRREQQQRLVRRRLRCIAQGRVRAVAIDVIDPEHVRQEQPVETAAFQRPGEIDPVGQAVIFGGAIARMGPQPG